MTVIELNDEEASALRQVLETLTRKSGKSPWWAALTRPLGGLLSRLPTSSRG